MDTEVTTEEAPPKKKKKRLPKEEKTYRVRLHPKQGRTSEGEDILFVTGCDISIEEAQTAEGVSTFSIISKDGSNAYCTELHNVYDCVSEHSLIREVKVKGGGLHCVLSSLFLHSEILRNSDLMDQRNYLIVSFPKGRISFKTLEQWCRWHDLEPAAANVVLESRFASIEGVVFIADNDESLLSLPAKTPRFVQASALLSEDAEPPSSPAMMPTFHEAKKAGMLSQPPRPPSSKPTLAPRPAPQEPTLSNKRDAVGRFVSPKKPKAKR